MVLFRDVSVNQGLANMARVALLIGTAEYESGFKPLLVAAENVRRLEQVLKDPGIGGFDVNSLITPDHSTMREEAETWLRLRTKEDLALLYITGHGVKDIDRKLYFAAKNTRKLNEELVASTAIAASDVRTYLRQCKAINQIVILDCCFSGAFADVLAMDDESVDIESALVEPAKEGRVVLTSSSSVQYSFAEQGASLSIYTQYLIEGLETGAADLNSDGAISVDEIHQFVSRKVQEVSSAMTPRIFVLKDEGYNLRLSKAPLGDPRLKYRKEIETIVQEDNGEISPINRECLNELRSQLEAFGLTLELAESIEQEVLEPFKQRRSKENTYLRVFAQAVQKQHPLSENDLSALRRFRRVLSLRDEDYESIESQVLNEIPLRASQPKNSLTESKDADDLNSEIRGNNFYINLRDFLKVGDWKKADEETLRTMLEVAGKTEQGWLDAETIERFPAQDFKKIDRLWVKYSGERFGFSLQKKVWEEYNSPSQSDENWKVFGDRIGWCVGEHWLSYGQINFNISAPLGHLPVVCGRGGIVSKDGLASIAKKLV